MIKTIKVKKQLRLDELIKYIFDNGIEDTKYPTSEIAPFGESEARISGSGNIKISGYINKNTTFTVEVDKEVTKNTPFEWLVGVNSYGSLSRYKVATITDVLGDDGADCFATKIYALIGNDLELIWERGENE